MFDGFAHIASHEAGIAVLAGEFTAGVRIDDIIAIREFRRDENGLGDDFFDSQSAHTEWISGDLNPGPHPDWEIQHLLPWVRSTELNY